MNGAFTRSKSATDEQLWRRSRTGDTEAFRTIVERYQNLVCSIAYSACGNLSQSEDLAQDTFIAAWQHLGELREPRHLKAWLCGIARRLAANTNRREWRRGGPWTPLDDTPEPAADSDPVAEAVSAEEETLMWHALERLPERYREPMVLFYRQGRSVSDVAVALDSSEDAVKQQLSRGRSMMRAEVARIVERALARSAPSVGFTVAVIAALPAVAPPSAAASVLAGVAGGQASGMAKGVLAGIGKGALIGPVIGLIVGHLSTRAAATTARSEPERRLIIRHARRMVLFSWLMSIGLVLALLGADKLYPASTAGIVAGILLWTATLTGVIWWTSERINRQAAQIRRETGTDDASYGGARSHLELAAALRIAYRSRWTLLGLPLLQVRICSGPTHEHSSRRCAGWIAIGDCAFSPLLAIGGIAVAPIALGAVTIGIVSLSLWGAALGLLAFGTIAVGTHAFGLAALGWTSARGGLAVSGHYALGEYAAALEANTGAARAWADGQWFMPLLEGSAAGAHWALVAVIALATLHIWWRFRTMGAGSAS